METTKLYNGEIELVFDPAKHLYTVDNKPVIGVTGAVGMINKPALIPWAVNMAIQNLAERWKPGKSYDEIEIKDILNEAKKIHRVKKQQAGDMGTMIHEWIEQWIAGENPELPVNEIMSKSVSSFLDWVNEYKIKFDYSERKVYSKLYNYAGTCDFTATIKNKNIVGDIKTSSGIYPEYFFQTAAYQQALQEEFPKVKYDANVIIRCGKDGAFEIAESEEFDKNLEAYLGILSVYKRFQELRDIAINGKK